MFEVETYTLLYVETLRIKK